MPRKIITNPNKDQWEFIPILIEARTIMANTNSPGLRGYASNYFQVL